MAATAIINDAKMVEVRRSPGDGRMAVITGVAALHMRGVLASRDCAVVATVAGSNHLRVINRKYGRKNIRVMAVLTNIAG